MKKIKHRINGQITTVSDEQFNSLINHPLGKGIFVVLEEIADVPSKTEMKKAVENLAKLSSDNAKNSLPETEEK